MSKYLEASSNINLNTEPTTEINEKPSIDELIERFAQVQGITKEEAQELVGAVTYEECIKKITDFTLDKIHQHQPVMNRAQRRALKKKVGAKKYAEMIADSGDEISMINETAEKLNYIDLIQKLRKLNEKKEKENGETTTEDN